MIIRFPVPDEPMSMNDRRANPRSRGGSIGLTKHKQAWRDTAEAYALDDRTVQSLPPVHRESNVRVSLPFKDQRRRDPANYMLTVKWIVDGLVRAGVWPDDGPEYVTVWEPILVVGNEVTVEIWPRTVVEA